MCVCVCVSVSMCVCARAESHSHTHTHTHSLSCTRRLSEWQCVFAVFIAEAEWSILGRSGRMSAGRQTHGNTPIANAQRGCHLFRFALF